MAACESGQGLLGLRQAMERRREHESGWDFGAPTVPEPGTPIKKGGQAIIAHYPGVRQPVPLALTKLVTGIVRRALVLVCQPGDEMGAARLEGHSPLSGWPACFPFPLPLHRNI
jgi:hypothetical protein